MLMLTSVGLTIVLPMATAIQLGQQSHLARDGALAFEFVFGIALAGYMACSTLHRECVSGTVLTVLSKPVSRHLFFAAKFTAVMLVLSLFIFESSAAALLGVRLTPVFFEVDEFGLRVVALIPFVALLPAALVNFITRRPFISYAQLGLACTMVMAVVAMGMVDREAHRIPFGSLLDWRLIPACALEGLALVLLASIALSLATRLNTAPTLAILIGLLFAGLISDYLATRLPHSPLLKLAFRSVIPNLQLFWPADELTGGGTITLAMLRHATVYTACYATGILCLGLTAFRSRQF